MTPSFNEDELISAYVDGRLSEQERIAFEARLRAEAGLRRHVMATQLLAREARQIAAVPTPRNFILPRDAGVARQPERERAPSWFPASLLRFGSVAAALAFVFFVGLDVMQSSSRTAVVAPAQPPAAPVLEAVPPRPMVAEMTAQAVEAGEATQGLPAQAPTERSAAQPAMVTALPMATAMLSEAVTDATGPSVMSASAADAASANGSQAAQPPQETDKLAVTATPQPTFAAPPATSATEPVSAQASPLITLPRVLALIALLIALALGFFGWLRR